MVSMIYSRTAIDKTRSTTVAKPAPVDQLGDYAREVDAMWAEHQPPPLWTCASCWGPAPIGAIYCGQTCNDTFRALMTSRLLTWAAK